MKVLHYDKGKNAWKAVVNAGQCEECVVCGVKLEIPFFFCEKRVIGYCSKKCEDNKESEQVWKCRPNILFPEHKHVPLSEIVRNPIK